MRKAITFVIIYLICLFSFSFAEEFNFHDLSFKEIQGELDTYNLKIWQAGNWSSVIVPEGIYIVGVDLPAGNYSIRSCTNKAKCDLELIPIGSDPDEYYHDSRYQDFFLSSSDKESIELISGDRIIISYAGVQFLISEYMPRFNPDPEQDAKVQQLTDEYRLLLSELKSRPEWREITVPEGLYQVGSKIPVDYWTIWPSGTRAGVYYGESLNSKGEIFYAEIRAALKDASLSSFEFGYHEGWVSIDAQEGWYIQVTDSVVFTPYIGTTPFLFNE